MGSSMYPPPPPPAPGGSYQPVASVPYPPAVGVPYQGYGGAPAGGFDPRFVPAPPRLHWGWVLALSLITRSLFNSIWMVVQASWIKRVTGRGDVLVMSIVNLCALPVALLLGIMFGMTIALVPGANKGPSDFSVGMFTIFIAVVALVIYVATAFRLKDGLESPAIGLKLSGVMTFLFSGIYFQYFLRDYAPLTPEEAYGQMQVPPAYVPPPPPAPPTAL